MFLSIIFKFHLKHLPIFCHVNVLVGTPVFHFYTVVISCCCFKEIHVINYDNSVKTCCTLSGRVVNSRRSTSYMVCTHERVPLFNA